MSLTMLTLSMLPPALLKMLTMLTLTSLSQTNDQVPGAWALWATYCDELFQNEVDKASQEKISLMDRVNVYKANLYHAESAIACYLQVFVVVSVRFEVVIW